MSKQGYQWFHKSTCVHPKKKQKKERNITDELTVVISVSPPPQVGGRPSVSEVKRVVVPVSAPDPGRTVRASVTHRRHVGTEKINGSLDVF